MLGPRAIAATIVPLALLAGGAALACTTFLQPVQGAAPVVGKSYDWEDGGGLVVANQRGVAKEAFGWGTRTPLRWTSRYQSLTFNQYGRELPNGGMNAAGLVVEIMWLRESEAEPADDRPVVTELQWIQWALDVHATVAELASAAPGVRIAPIYAPVHYLACDKGGACAAFELLEGRLVITHGAPALTNHSYADASAHVARGGPPGKGRGSLARFARAVDRSRAPVPAADAVSHAFETLHDVSQGRYSKWRIVYEPAAGRVHFQTHDSPATKQVALSDFGAACGTPVEILDIDHTPAGAAGDAFAPYTRAVNEARVAESLRRLGVPLLERLASVVAGYPDTLTCAAAR